MRLLRLLVLVVLLGGVARAASPPPRTTPADQPVSAYTLPPELRTRAEAYAHAHRLQYLVGTLWGLASLALLIKLRVAPRLSRAAQHVSKRRFVQALAFTPPFLLALAALELPLGLWSHTVERKFGLSVQGWGSWTRDWAVGQVLGLLLGTLLVWVLYAVMRKSPRRFWLWAWMAMMPILVFVVFIEPFVVEPLFFKFDPLAQKRPEVAAQLGQVVKNAGLEIPAERMFVMEASSKLNAVNAYVTGIGAGKRVVVWDTTLAAMEPREIAFVFGHELGHYVLGHVMYGLGLGALGLLLVLWLGARVLRLVCRDGRWGIAAPDDWGSLPVVLLTASLLGTLSSPLSAMVSRAMEHQADAFGLHVIEGVVADPPQSAAHAFQRLGEIDLAEPDPDLLTVFLRYDHPPIRDRVRFVLGR
jgi:STE24 endopeptidase